MSSPVLSANNLKKTYRLGRVDVPVLKGATMHINRGEWVAVLGVSGSGKSTLLHLMGDLDRPDTDSGAMTFESREVQKMSRTDRNTYRSKSVGFVFQFYHLLPELTVLENTLISALVAKSLRPRWVWMKVLLNGALIGALFAVVAWLLWRPPMLTAMWYWFIAASLGAGLGAVVVGPLWSEIRAITLRRSPQWREMKARATKLLESFGLGHRLKHRPRELSGGERQRVAIARALMNDPDILLADEPTGNLDEETGGTILDLIADQHRKGLTIVMVTHDPAVAARADRTVNLHHGRVETVT